jgi:hypothetical protein
MKIHYKIWVYNRFKDWVFLAFILLVYHLHFLNSEKSKVHKELIIL